MNNVKIAYDDFDAIFYCKSGKYPYVSELQDDFCDIFKAFAGMTASAGAVIVSPKKCAVFVDGRYKLAANISVDKNKFKIMDYNFSIIFEWIRENIPEGGVIAYDPRFFSARFVDRIKTKLSEYSFRSIDLRQTLNMPLLTRKLEICKIERNFPESKFIHIYNAIKKNNLDAYLLCDPCSIAWLLNIRDFDSCFSPVVFGYLLIKKNFDSVLYLDELYNGVVNPLECGVKIIKSENELPRDLEKLSIVGTDEFEAPSHIYLRNFKHVSNPCTLPKAIKNDAEIRDIKEAAKIDSAAIINLMRWIYSNKKDLTEIDVAEKLEEFRRQNSNYIGESFRCISAADEHSAIIHYSPTSESNAAVKNILLLDSGGQYKYGTTDITRTICLNNPTIKQKLFYTLVLKGHIAVANAKFPEGIAFSQIEPLARQFLWQNSADYPHSTSHGIGYLSCVHESIASAAATSKEERRAALVPGMVISNEPGYYEDGCFGIRLENMMLVKDCLNGYLSFGTISLVPFDLRFIDENLLTEIEKKWLFKYHENICVKLKRFLSEDVMNWLQSYIKVF